eukprot:scaffold7307_cov125-Isochrysis_galbana.AAC.5
MVRKYGRGQAPAICRATFFPSAGRQAPASRSKHLRPLQTQACTRRVSRDPVAGAAAAATRARHARHIQRSRSQTIMCSFTVTAVHTARRAFWTLLSHPPTPLSEAFKA